MKALKDGERLYDYGGDDCGHVVVEKVLIVGNYGEKTTMAVVMVMMMTWR